MQVGGIKGQGRDTAQGHVSKGGWHPPVFPIHCLHKKLGGRLSWTTLTLGGSSTRLDGDGEFTASLTNNPLGCNRALVPSNQPPGMPAGPGSPLQTQGAAPRIPHQCLVNPNVSLSTPSQPRGSPLPHQRDVDAVGSSHGRKRHVPADDGWQVLGGASREHVTQKVWGQSWLSLGLPPSPCKTLVSPRPTGENRSLLPCNTQLVKAARPRESRGSHVPSQPWREAKG